jgi:hypothetical protein
MNQAMETTTRRLAAPSDVEKRNAQILRWDNENSRLAPALAAAEESMQESLQALDRAGDSSPATELLKQLEGRTEQVLSLRRELSDLGTKPVSITADEEFSIVTITGGKSVFWTGGVKPIDESGNLLNIKAQRVGETKEVDDATTEVALAYPEGTKLRGFGNFQLDFLLYRAVGLDLKSTTNAWLDTLSLPAKIVIPFLVMIGFSFVTRSNSDEGLDRYYTKMKTPVDPDRQADQRNLEPTRIATRSKRRNSCRALVWRFRSRRLSMQSDSSSVLASASRLSDWLRSWRATFPSEQTDGFL